MRWLVIQSLPALALLTASLGGQQPVLQSGSLDAGKRLFEISCARCHGIGGGGDLGPSLSRPELPRAATDSALVDIIQNGIKGTSMPSLFYISDNDARLITAYVRSLGRVAAEPLPGSAENGRAIYQRLGCAGCHTISGIGGVIGPELTSIGARRSPANLRMALVDPAAALSERDGFVEYLKVHIETIDGRVIDGIRVNEDGFSIQLRGMNGRFYSFSKSKLRKLEKQFKASPMPSYRALLSAAELDDMVAYLATRRGGGAR